MQHALRFTVNLSYIQHKTLSIKDVKAKTWSNHSKKLTVPTGMLVLYLKWVIILLYVRLKIKVKSSLSK